MTLKYWEGRYFTTSDYKRFISDTLHAEIKTKTLANKSDISNLVKNSEGNIKLVTLATTSELKAEHV